MNPDDFVKAAPAIAKIAGPLAAAVPLTPIIKAILGPAADELGQRFGDRVRLYRYGRSLDMLKKAEKMAKDAGFTPKAVPIKLLFPLLEGASFEEDEDLHTMWAALLANAASPENSEKVRPGFIAILRQMAPDEALLLKWIVAIEGDVVTSEGIDLDRLSAHYRGMRSWEPIPSVSHEILPKLYTESTEFATCMDCLKAQGLLHKQGSEYFITTLGFVLIQACSAPKPQK